MSYEFVQVVTPFGIDLRPIKKYQMRIDSFLNTLIGDYLEDLNIPIFVRKGIKYIAKKDLDIRLEINKTTSGNRHKFLKENGFYSYPIENVSRKEYGARKKSPLQMDFTSYGRALILLSVDDAIIFIAHGQSTNEKLETIKKLLKELSKYKNLSKQERKLRLKDCWRNILHLDEIAYEFIITSNCKKWDAYEKLWDTEIWSSGKIELYRYLHLKGIKLLNYNDCRLHHEEYDFKHIFSKADFIHKDKHKKGRLNNER